MAAQPGRPLAEGGGKERDEDESMERTEDSHPSLEKDQNMTVGDARKALQEDRDRLQRRLEAQQTRVRDEINE